MNTEGYRKQRHPARPRLPCLFRYTNQTRCVSHGEFYMNERGVVLQWDREASSVGPVCIIEKCNTVEKMIVGDVAYIKIRGHIKGCERQYDGLMVMDEDCPCYGAVFPLNMCRDWQLV